MTAAQKTAEPAAIRHGAAPALEAARDAPLSHDEAAALRRAYEMPAYQPHDEAPLAEHVEAQLAEHHEPPLAEPITARSTVWIIGFIAAVIGLAVGFAIGYLIRGQVVTEAAPVVVTSVNGPVDANGLNLGRRVPPDDTVLPFGLSVDGPVDANGLNLGRRVPVEP